MRRISSRLTFVQKRVFPTLWFGFLTLFLGISLFTIPRSGSAALPFLLIPLGMMIFGYFLMRLLIFDLVDEVWDDGDTLIVKNRGQEQRIPLADIKNVSYTVLVNPPRVTLSLRRPTVFGDKVVFSPPVAFIPFATSPIINEMIERVDVARQQQASRSSDRR
jgi:hypothetical protein